MDAVRLLAKARGAGLVVRAEGEKLVVCGPRKAEKLALHLLDRKGEVLPLLTQPQPAASGREASPRWAVRMWSALLQEGVWVVVDSEPPPAFPCTHVKKLEPVAPGAIAWVPAVAGVER
jgi:hypothetical protein